MDVSSEIEAPNRLRQFASDSSRKNTWNQKKDLPKRSTERKVMAFRSSAVNTRSSNVLDQFFLLNSILIRVPNRAATSQSLSLRGFHTYSTPNEFFCFLFPLPATLFPVTEQFMHAASLFILLYRMVGILYYLNFADCSRIFNSTLVHDTYRFMLLLEEFV